MAKAWILVGMMGAGKSSLGRALADATEREFLDTDQILQARLGRSIRQMFQIYGEAAFRDHEHAVLRSLEPGPSVISTGGGIVLRSDNWEEMRRLGTTVYLEADAETLKSRLARSAKKRPLLEAEDWEDRVSTILEARKPLYEKADLRFVVDESTLDASVERLRALLEERT